MVIYRGNESVTSGNKLYILHSVISLVNNSLGGLSLGLANYLVKLYSTVRWTVTVESGLLEFKFDASSSPTC